MPNFIYAPPSDPIQVLFEDEDLLIANKPAGLLSVPGRLPEHKDSLMLRLEQSHGELHCVHRLDMDTSGIMIIARNKATLSNLSRQFQQRTVKKSYKAIVIGKLDSPKGEIDLPLITDWPNRPRQKICEKTGKPSVTQYQQLSSNDIYTLVNLHPITGRSHQLRVHMMALGHPILGCRFYGSDKALAASTRLMLHAEEIHFSHPSTMESISIFCDSSFDGVFTDLKEWTSN